MTWKIPEKDKWLIVGCGQSANMAASFLRDNPESGLITLNMAASGFKRVDIAVFIHYQSIVLSLPYFENIDLALLPDPCIVGNAVSTQNVNELYEYNLLENPNVKIFKRAPVIEEVTPENDALFNDVTVATAALSLIYKLGLKEVYTAGVGGDCDTGSYNFDVCKYPPILRNEPAKKTYWSYEDTRFAFQNACDRWGITWHRL